MVDEVKVTLTPLEGREAEFREALAYSEQIASGKVFLAEDTDVAEYWASVEDIKAKLAQIEQHKEEMAAAASPLAPGLEELLGKRVLAKVSPFVTYAPEGGRVDVVTALKVGETPETIKEMGVLPSQVAEAQKYITEEKAYREFRTENVEIKPDVWVSKEEWRVLTPSQQAEVKETGQYTTIPPAPSLLGDIISGVARQREATARLREQAMVTPTFETWTAKKGATKEFLAGLEPWDRAQTLKELRASYQEEIKPSLTGKMVGLPWYGAAGVMAGMVATPIALATTPTWGPFALGVGAGVIKFGGATLVGGTSYALTRGAMTPAPKETWEEKKQTLYREYLASPKTRAEIAKIEASGEYKAVPPTFAEFSKSLGPAPLEYRGGLLGTFGRGIEGPYGLGGPARILQEKGPLGQVAAGTYQYFFPQTLFAQQYPTKGALAALTMIPHFGPTLGYAGLTWKEQTPLGKAAGIGFGLLPYATGPLGTALRGVGAGVGKVPVLGTAVRAATWPISKIAQGVAPITLAVEKVAPWQAAYQVGRRVPGYGPYATRMGWLGSTVPYSQALRQAGWGPIEWGPGGILPASVSGAGGYRAISEPAFPVYREPVYTSYLRAEPPGIYAAVPSYAPGLLGKVKFAIPRVAAAAVAALPLAPVAVQAPGVSLPMIVPSIVTPQMVQQDLQIVSQMLEQGQITSTQHTQIVKQVQNVAQKQLTQTQYQQKVQTVVQNVLTEEQQAQFKVTKQQVQTETQQQTPLQQIVQQNVMQQQFQQQMQQMQQQQQTLQQQMQQQQVQQQQQQQVVRGGGFPLVPFGRFKIPIRIGGLWGGGGGAGGYGFPSEVGRWEFGKASLYLPGVTGPVLPARRYGAVTPEKRGIVGARVDGGVVGQSTRNYKVTVAA